MIVPIELRYYTVAELIWRIFPRRLASLSTEAVALAVVSQETSKVEKPKSTRVKQQFVQSQSRYIKRKSQGTGGGYFQENPWSRL